MSLSEESWVAMKRPTENNEEEVSRKLQKVEKATSNIDGFDVFMKHMINAVREDIQSLNHVSEEMLRNRCFIMALVRTNSWALTWSPEFMDDREIVLEAFIGPGSEHLFGCAESISTEIFQHVSQRLRDDREIASAAVSSHYETMAYVSDRLKDDKDFIMTELNREYSENMWAYAECSVRLQNDRDVALTAIVQALGYGEILEYVPHKFLNDKDFILDVSRQNGYVLEYVEQFQNDKEVVMAAVRNCGKVLEYASPELRGDREIVMAAVRQNGYALQYASDELRGDREIVLAAVVQNGLVLRYASEVLKSNCMLQWISTTNLELLWAKQRLALAKSTMPMHSRYTIDSLSVLTRDLIDLIGKYISPSLSISAIANKCEYWTNDGTVRV